MPQHRCLFPKCVARQPLQLFVEKQCLVLIRFLVANRPFATSAGRTVLHFPYNPQRLRWFIFLLALIPPMYQAQVRNSKNVRCAALTLRVLWVW